MIRLGDVWERAIAFVRAEGALVMPIAFAFFGLPTLLGFFSVPTLDVLQKGVGLGALAISAAISSVGTLFGGLAISALVLRPGGSVGDALATGARRLGVGMAAALIAGLALVALAFVLVLIGAVFVIATRGSAVAPSATDPGLVAVAFFAMIAVLIALVRLATLVPMLIDRPLAPLDAVRATLAQTRPVFWRLLLLTVLYNVAVQVAVRALEFGGGSVAKLLAMAAGGGGLLDALVMIASAALAAAASGFWAVLMALLYRALTPADPSAVFE